MNANASSSPFWNDGYNCSTCGMWVSPNTLHTCGGAPIAPIPTTTWTTTSGISYLSEVTFQRVADALERIAELLEGKDETPEA